MSGSSFAHAKGLDSNESLLASTNSRPDNPTSNEKTLKAAHPMTSKLSATSNSNSSHATASTSSNANDNSFLPSDYSSPVSDDKKRQHCCPFCDRSFTRPYRLNDHISFSHTDEVSSFASFGLVRFLLTICSFFCGLKYRENTCAHCARSISHARTS